MWKAKNTLFWTCIIAGSIACLIMVSVIAYTVASRTIANNYTARLKLSLNAAALTSGLYVKAEDGYHELDDDSYRKLSFYLTIRPVLAIIGGDKQSEERIELLIGEDTVLIAPRGNDGDRAVVYFETAGKSYRISIRNNDLWRDLHSIVDESHYYTPEPDVPEESKAV